MLTTENLAEVARALGDPQRVEIVRICAKKAVNVRRLAEKIGISDPLVSHHLKTLTAAGLLSRERRGREVTYAIARQGARAEWLAGCLSAMGQEGQEWQEGQAQPHPVPADPAGETRLDRAVADAALRALGSDLVDASLYAETERVGLLRRLLVSGARRGAIVATSHAAAVALRRQLRPDLAPTFEIATRRSVDAGDRFRIAVMDRLGADRRQPVADDLRDLRLRLDGDGRCVFVVPYDALDDDTEAGHPLLRLRRLITAAGLRCDQIQPIEAQGGHVLLALATYVPAAQRVA